MVLRDVIDTMTVGGPPTKLQMLEENAFNEVKINIH